MGAFQTVDPKKVKTFITQVHLPFQFTRILKLYEAVSRLEEDFTNDLYSLLRDPNNLTPRFSAYWENLAKRAIGYGLEPEITLEARADLNKLVSLLQMQLYEYGFYDSNFRLKFNCLWIEKPDVLVFFRVELPDVDFTGTSTIPK